MAFEPESLLFPHLVSLPSIAPLISFPSRSSSLVDHSILFTSVNDQLPMVSTTILISRSNNDDSANQASSSAYPSYGTRTRKNIRPSARLRQSPESNTPHRKLKLFSRARPGSLPQTSNFPNFPPPNVMLHSEDANNKVLMAIGRSFLSVVRLLVL